MNCLSNIFLDFSYVNFFCCDANCKLQYPYSIRTILIFHLIFTDEILFFITFLVIPLVRSIPTCTEYMKRFLVGQIIWLTLGPISELDLFSAAHPPINIIESSFCSRCPKFTIRITYIQLRYSVNQTNYCSSQMKN